MPITRNAARCLGCETVVESRHRHDFETCMCGALSVDGGLDYNKRVFDPGVKWEELSEGDFDDYDATEVDD